MAKLLRANFSRLWKSRIFYVSLIFMVVLNLFLVIDGWHSGRQGYPQPLEDMLFQNCIIIGFVCAVVVGMFLGTEYSDGTIRNKIAVGHTRVSIYLANLIICAAASALLLLISLAIGFGLGSFLLAPLGLPLKALLLYTLIGLLTTVSFASIYTLVAMLSPSKASGAVLCLVLSLVLLFATSAVEGTLTEPEMVQDYVMTENGMPIPGDPHPNPRYVTGTKRAVLEVIYDVLPTGQAFQISNNECAHPARLPAFSLLLTLVTSAAGAILFRRRDLK
ncbi:MAG: ABC transporter permease subunit [Clostridia bacterium]|nr:ABC transporter permease subunit [Clostridia bacterium]